MGCRTYQQLGSRTDSQKVVVKRVSVTGCSINQEACGLWSWERAHRSAECDVYHINVRVFINPGVLIKRC